MVEELLRIDNLSLSENNDSFLRNINLNVFKGELLSLFGVHKSGKTLLGRVIGGFTAPTSGQIYFDGMLLPPYSYAQAQEQGIFYLNRSSMLIPSLTVVENIFAIRRHRFPNVFYNKSKIQKNAQIFFSEYKIDIPLSMPVRNLNGFQVLLVQIFKALLMGARLIILDDYCADIYISHYPVLKKLMGDLKDISFVYISNSIDPLVECSDRIAVMSRGGLVKYIYNEEYTSSLLMKCAYGHYWNESFERISTLPGLPVFSIEGMAAGNKTISLSVSQREVVGIYDIDGCGQQIIDSLTLEPVSPVIMSGKKITSYRDAVRSGLAIISGQYLDNNYFPCFTPQDNAAFQMLRPISRLGIIKRHMEKYLYRQYNDSPYSISLSDNWTALRSILYRKLLPRPRIMVLDNITSGFSSDIRREIFQTLSDAAQQGLGILFIFSDLVECFGFCDRILIPSEQDGGYLTIYPHDTTIEESVSLINL
ncbi:ATP-binding cassette domain-containing protein [Extibacter muris]|uniref:ATP-binding cassette domain-containing protein n=1 Tax=Extibacter muris TaxID=1796622 RepID=UPI001D09280D|nr:ATP-binding cassette domain-containing protein [Extibacter muris]MCB6203235.1 ATP-binding cassette domain-containing protein [Extibacter muris]MCQ4664831.1 ATP-binding cassette domain-containing protein [Extibacter muris]MCQ4694840.1 ATP-binding cassette domain-containing protein [Extibacter muris]